METAEESSAGKSDAGTGATLAAVLVVLAVLAGVVLLVKGLYPDDLTMKANPSFIDSTFQNKLGVWFARLLLVSGALVLAFGGAFIIASTVVRMKNQEWLRRAGPFEVSETAVTELEEQVAFWRSAALEGQNEIADLRERLEESDELIEQLHLAMDDG
jgi:hypothetical protein